MLPRVKMSRADCNPWLAKMSYIVAVSFIGGGNRNTRSKLPTCLKSLTSFISDLWQVSGFLQVSFVIVCEKCEFQTKVRSPGIM
jgi:hypothetical protein